MVKQESPDVECISPLNSWKPIVTPEMRWNELRDYILRKGSPIYRYRFEAFWMPTRLQDPEKLLQHQQFLITVRAIGPRSKVFANSESSYALYHALKHRNIVPDAIQRQKDDTEWPNTWTILIKMEDCSKLPSYHGRYKGIFWNPDNCLFLYVWNVVPTTPQERLLMEGRQLTFEAHCPMLFIPSPAILDGLKNHLCLRSKGSKTDYPLDVKSAEFGVTTYNDLVIRNGNFDIVIGQLPSHEEFRRFIRSPSARVLVAWYHDQEFSCKLLAACSLCGTDGHKEATCPYKNTVQTVLSEINRIRKDVEEDIVETSLSFKKKTTGTNANPTRTEGLQTQAPVGPRQVRPIQVTRRARRYRPAHPSGGPRHFRPTQATDSSRQSQLAQASSGSRQLASQPKRVPHKIRPSSVPPVGSHEC